MAHSSNARNNMGEYGEYEFFVFVRPEDATAQTAASVCGRVLEGVSFLSPVRAVSCPAVSPVPPCLWARGPAAALPLVPCLSLFISILRVPAAALTGVAVGRGPDDLRVRHDSGRPVAAGCADRGGCGFRPTIVRAAHCACHTLIWVQQRHHCIYSLHTLLPEVWCWCRATPARIALPPIPARSLSQLASQLTFEAQLLADFEFLKQYAD